MQPNDSPPPFSPLFTMERGENTQKVKKNVCFNQTTAKQGANFRGRPLYQATNKWLYYKQTIKDINPLNLRPVEVVRYRLFLSMLSTTRSGIIHVPMTKNTHNKTGR